MSLLDLKPFKCSPFPPERTWKPLEGPAGLGPHFFSGLSHSPLPRSAPLSLLQLHLTDPSSSRFALLGEGLGRAGSEAQLESWHSWVDPPPSPGL